MMNASTMSKTLICTLGVSICLLCASCSSEDLQNFSNAAQNGSLNNAWNEGLNNPINTEAQQQESQILQEGQALQAEHQ